MDGKGSAARTTQGCSAEAPPARTQAAHSRGACEPKSFLLTFDDGFRNFMEQAFPVLRELNYTALLFAIPDWVGATNDWPSQPKWVPRLPLLTWTDLRLMADAGMELGA